jgi:integrase
MNGVGVSTFPDLTAVRIWAYVATWKLEPGTHRNALTRLRTFLDFAVEKNWLETNPLIIKKQRRTRAVRTVSKGKPRIPFTNDELDRMFKACDAYGTEMREHTYTGEDLKDFIALSVYTGLRISDIATFDASRLNADGTVFIRETLKGNVPVSTWVPDWLAARIRYRARVYGSLIFGKHATSNNEVITEAWRRRLRELWEGMGEWKTHPVPHRFRHTFARILLQRHVPASAVAELMGNTEKIVLRHYANYVQERQDATIKVLKKCFADVPQPKFQPAKNNVVRMPRKPTNAALVRQQA